MRGSRGGDRGPGPPLPLKNHKCLDFFSNTGPDPLKNHKATKPKFNVGPLSARQRFAGGPMMAPLYWHLDLPSPSSTNKLDPL